MQVGGFGLCCAGVAHEGYRGSGGYTVADAFEYAVVPLVNGGEVSRMLHDDEMAVVGIVTCKNDYTVSDTAYGTVQGAPDVKAIVVFVRTEKPVYGTKGRWVYGKIGNLGLVDAWGAGWVILLHAS